MRAGLIATLAVAAAGCGIEPAVDVAPGWQLVWHDEFDGAANATLDPDRWLHDVGGHGWGNRQLEFDTDRVENSSLDGSGHLVITARREAYGDNDYTSARITSRERFALTYGRFEARIRLPAGPGLWPAFWLLGENFPVVGWPECGEIDIMEHRGSEPTKNYGLAHGPGFAGGENIGGRYVLPEGARFADDFHDFVIEWDPGRIVWLVDEVPYQVLVPTDLYAGDRWVFDTPMYIILNLAIGGTFAGPPDEAGFPQSMLVDHVRVSRRTTD